jgi:hypothetical protein
LIADDELDVLLDDDEVVRPLVLGRRGARPREGNGE